MKSTLTRFSKTGEDGRDWHWVVGARGAVTLMVMQLPKEVETILPWPDDFRVTGSVDRHSPVPLTEYDKPQGPCEWIESVCYCDGTSLYGTTLAKMWVEGEEEAVWTALERLYRQWLLGEGDE